VLGLVAAGFGIAWARRAPAPLPVVRFAIANPEGTSTVGPPAVSPDGRSIAFDAADGSGKRQIWIRALDAIDIRALPGTEGALRPIWSPDSRFVAFVAEGKLRKVPVAGGPPQTICDAPRGADGSWSASGTILFDGRGGDPIWRVDASGGVAKIEVAVDADKGASSVGWPEFLPDGRHFLYMSGPTQSDRTLMVRALDSSDAKPLFKTTSRVLYAPPGFLLYVRDRTLVAQAFDPASLEIKGEPVPIGEGLGVNTVGLASFHSRARACSRSGQVDRRGACSSG
jgi:dipeptidyl aminopeptidase/acylaminoacyl peptidase